MKHKYLHELFPNGDITYPYSEEDCADFDVRETYDMARTLIAWLYEHLRYFQEKASQIINFEFYEFEINGEELTQIQCIDRMVEDCKIILTSDDWNEFDKMEAAKNDLFDILSKVYWAMWW